MAAAKKRARKRKPAQDAPRLWVPKLGMFVMRVFTGALFIDVVYYKLWLTRMRAPDPTAPDGGGLGLGLLEALEHFVEHDYKPLVLHASRHPPSVLGAELTWFSGFMENVMLPGAVPAVVGPAILLFELILGFALVLGVGVRLMGVLGAALVAVFAMAKGSYVLSISGGTPETMGSNWILVVVLLALALTASGRLWGLDSRLQHRLPGWVS